MPGHDITHLEARLEHVSKLRAAFADDTGVNELRQLIHRPGWTTVAEHTLMLTSMEQLATQLAAAHAFHDALLAAARQIGQTG